MRLPKHPVPMTTVFRRCLLANYAITPDALAAVLPGPLVPDLAAGSSWLSVVIADMAQMRPAGTPRPLGVSYRQVVYRAVVRCGPDRGVHFLRSDADSKIMTIGGNLLSFFRFHYAPVTWTSDGDGDRVRVLSHDGSADIDLVLGPAAAAGPAAVGAFPSLAAAKEHLVNVYSALNPRDGHGRVDVVHIERSDWQITVAPVIQARCAFLDGAGPFPAGTAVLDSVFQVSDLPYYWHRLQTVTLPPGTGHTPA